MAINTSEWVSLGHSDKVADYISSYILDRYIENDPNVRYAVEVMIKDHNVILGGEISSTVDLSNYYHQYVIRALQEIGYTKEYHYKWEEYAIDPDKIVVHSYISQQSSNIAKGVDNNGWGDQGIFYGYAENSEQYIPKDFLTARRFGWYLYRHAKYEAIGGLDIKTQISYSTDKDTIEKVIVAIPILNNEEQDKVYNLIHNVKEAWERYYNVDNIPLIINGTGEYKVHSSIGDCGITGRKLVVDFYGSGSKIGGGAMTTKDPTKADLSLNLYARKLAVKELKKLLKNDDTIHHVEVQLNSCIGKPCEDVVYKVWGKDKLIDVRNEKVCLTPQLVIDELDLRKPIYSSLCRYGFFSKISLDN